MLVANALGRKFQDYWTYIAHVKETFDPKKKKKHILKDINISFGLV